MKLAEALIQRADCQKRIAQLKSFSLTFTAGWSRGF
jgi:hypothetical protein